MFKFLLSYGARLDVRNALNYTATTLAAHLARKEVICLIIGLKILENLIKI